MPDFFRTFGGLWVIALLFGLVTIPTYCFIAFTGPTTGKLLVSAILFGGYTVLMTIAVYVIAKLQQKGVL